LESNIIHAFLQVYLGKYDAFALTTCMETKVNKENSSSTTLNISPTDQDHQTKTIKRKQQVRNSSSLVSENTHKKLLIMKLSRAIIVKHLLALTVLMMTMQLLENSFFKFIEL
jgi:hypothetical protein